MPGNRTPPKEDGGDERGRRPRQSDSDTLSSCPEQGTSGLGM